MSAHIPTFSDRSDPPLTRRVRVRDALLLLSCLVFVYLVYGSVPFTMLGHLGIVEWQIGFAQSLATGGFLSYPSHMGYPFGAPIVFGASYAYLQALLLKLLPLSGIDSYGLTSMIFLTFAFWGAVGLSRRFGAGRVLSYVMAASYLSSPFLILHASYAALAYGMAMLPAYAYLTLVCFSVVMDTAARPRKRFLHGLGFIAGVVFALFLDGYTYVMFFVLGIFFVVHASLGNGAATRLPLARLAWAGALYVLAFGTAYVLMKAYVPALDELRLQNADVFRSMGLDLYFVLHPGSGVHWLANSFGLTVEYDAGRHYGDASLAIGSYLGLSLVILLLGLFHSRLAPRWRGLAVLLLAFSFLLSLGPSLKYDARRLDVDVPGKPINQYHMPREAGVFDFGLDRAYESVPGIKNMRATYRWHALTLFFIWFLAVAFLARLNEDGRRGLMFALLLVYVIDRVPDPFFVIDRARKYHAYAETMTRDVILEMGKYLKPGEIIYFWPSGNDFFANYAASMLGVRAYNVGGDKNMDIARAHWPIELLAVEQGECLTGNLHALAGSGRLDTIIAPKFSMWMDVSLPWPLAPEIVRRHEHAFRAGPLNSAEFDIRESRYFYVLKSLVGNARSRAFLDPGRNLYWSTDAATGGNDCLLRGKEGFSQPENWGTWTMADRARFEVNLGHKAVAPLDLEFEWLGFTTREQPVRTASLYVSGVLVKRLEHRYGAPPAVDRVALPDDLVAGKTRLPIEIVIDRPQSPKELGMSEDPRMLGVALRRFCVARPGDACSD